MTAEDDWREYVTRAVLATAETVESAEDGLNIVGELPWPTDRGPFYVSAQWLKINGRNRLAGITVRTVQDSASLREFIPLTAQTFRRIRIGDIVDRLTNERRTLNSTVLNDDGTSTSPATRDELESDERAWDSIADGRRNVSTTLDSDTDDLLRQVGRLFDEAHAAGSRSPATVVLNQLAAIDPNFRPTTPAVRSAFQARIGRLIRRARDLGYLKTPPLTRGRQRKDTES